MTNNKILILLTAILMNGSAFALQEFDIANNGEITAVVSDYDVSRITIANSRIDNVTLSSKQLKVDTDDKTGQIYVHPIKPNKSTVSTIKIGNMKAQAITGSTVNMFVTDVEGRTYTLRLRLQSVPSETILIRPLRGASGSVGGSTDFTNQVVTMIEDMYLDRKNDDGYVVSEEDTKIKLWKEVNFMLYKTYTDNRFVGSVFILQNISGKEITLAENQFWKPNTVAVAIEKPVLANRELTKVFVIGAKQDE